MTGDEIAEEEICEFMKAAWEAGDNRALMHMIQFCAIQKRPLPEWAAQAVEIAVSLAQEGKIKSWDDVFGSPIPLGRQARGLGTSRKRFAVWVRVRESRLPIDKAFEHVARELGMSTSTVRDLYYKVDRAVRRVQDQGLIDEDSPA